jgi:hypothetical protein
MKSNTPTQKMTCKDLILSQKEDFEKDELSICKNVPSCQKIITASSSPFLQNGQSYIEKFEKQNGTLVEKFCKSQNFKDKVETDLCIAAFKNSKIMVDLENVMKFGSDLQAKCNADLGIKK